MALSESLSPFGPGFHVSPWHISRLHDAFAQTSSSARMPFVCAYWAHSYLSPKYSLSRHVPGKPSLTSSDRLKCSLQGCCITYRPCHGLLPSSFPLFISCCPTPSPPSPPPSLCSNITFFRRPSFTTPLKTTLHKIFLIPSSALLVFLHISFIVYPSPGCTFPEGMDSGLFGSLLQPQHLEEGLAHRRQYLMNK